MRCNIKPQTWQTHYNIIVSLRRPPKSQVWNTGFHKCRHWVGKCGGSNGISPAVPAQSDGRRGWCCWLQECCHFRVVNGVGLLQQWGIFCEMLGVDSRRPLWQRDTFPTPWERRVSSALWYRTLFLWPPFITMLYQTTQWTLRMRHNLSLPHTLREYIMEALRVSLS